MGRPLSAGGRPSRSPYSAWPIGHGVVGKAWSEAAFIRAVGAACHDETHGLTPDQQARYAHVQVVAAIPVRNDHGATIGVVSATSLDESSRLAEQDGYEELLLVAQLVARVLIDVLRWFA